MLSPVISALNQHLIDAALQIPIAWENSIPPPESGSYIAAFFIPDSTTGATLGDTGVNQTTGLYQIDINTETGNGWAGLHKLADRMQRHYRLGLLLTHDGQSCQITGSSRSGGRIEGGRYRLSLTIQWLSYSRRDGLPGDFSSADAIDKLVNVTLPDDL